MGKNWKIKAANETSEEKEFLKETVRMIRWEGVRKIEDGPDESVRRHVETRGDTEMKNSEHKGKRKEKDVIRRKKSIGGALKWLPEISFTWS